MASQGCKCGHLKRDHNIVKFSNYGSCKICLCNSYQVVEAKSSCATSSGERSGARLGRTRYSMRGY